jgi:hypothetical protein
MTEKKPRHLYITTDAVGKPIQVARTSMIQCAYEIGAFAAVASIQCEVSYPDQWYGPGEAIKVTYWDDHAYTALRIQFGHRFVTPNPEPKKDMPTFPTPSRVSRQGEWAKILQHAAEEEDSKAAKQDERIRDILRKIASNSRY